METPPSSDVGDDEIVVSPGALVAFSLLNY